MLVASMSQGMGPHSDRVPLVRCRLDGPEDGGVARLRYIPQAEFDLWRHMMETRHSRKVTVEAVSIWIAEEAARWNSGFAADDLEPVLRVVIERPGPHGVPLAVERYFPAETYPRAQEALLNHFSGVSRPLRVFAVPGYFVPVTARRSARSA